MIATATAWYAGSRVGQAEATAGPSSVVEALGEGDPSGEVAITFDGRALLAAVGVDVWAWTMVGLALGGFL